VVFATFPVAGAIPGSMLLFNIIFFAVVISTLLQGLTFEPLARRLRLTSVSPVLPRPLVEFGGPRSLGAELVEFPVTSTDGVVGRRVGDLALPPGISVVVVVRGNQAIPPAGSTRMNAGDMVHLLVRSEVARWIPELLDSLRDPESTSFARPQPRGSA
jgi:cell volume regulation protein A